MYAPRQRGRSLQEILAGQMQYTYFPVPLGELAATIRYHELTEGEFELGGVRVMTRYLNHPAPVLGYRLEAGGVSVVYATDHEPHSRHHTEQRPADGVAPVHAEDKRHIEFLSNADLVIHDAQYTLEEYPEHLSWGHCPAEWAVDFAVAAHAKRLALYHHDPSRTDRAVESLLSRCRQRAANKPDAPEIFAAAEGQYLVVVRPGAETAATSGAASATIDERAASREKATILVADDDPDVMAVLLDTLEPEGFRVLSANTGEAALALARAEFPDVIVLDWMMPGKDGLQVCRELRAETDPRLAEVPVVLITGRSDAADTATGFDAGVTDYLTKPFKPSVLLTRLHAWLLRTGPGRGANSPPPTASR